MAKVNPLSEGALVALAALAIAPEGSTLQELNDIAAAPIASAHLTALARRGLVTSEKVEKEVKESKPPPPEDATRDERLDTIRSFDRRPKEIRDYLDRFVIKQEQAKRVLSVAVCDHYNHVRRCLENEKLAKNEYVKPNVLLLGPTGVGKTFVAINAIAQVQRSTVVVAPTIDLLHQKPFEKCLRRL